MIRKTPGEILKTTRETKKITIEKAAETTNITMRHLRALEENNFSVFPGETYVIGFLQNYATYLKIDNQIVVQAYKESLLAETETPLVELTQPTITPFDNLQKYFKYTIGFLVITVIIFIGIKVFDSSPKHNKHSKNVNNFFSDSEKVPDINTRNLKIRNGYATDIISIGEGINFPLSSKQLHAEIYLLLKKLEFKAVDGNLSRATLELYPGKSKIILIEGKEKEISLKKLPRKFKVSIEGATELNIKLRVSLGKVKEVTDISNKVKNTDIKNPDNFIIYFVAQTTGSNYLEIYVDGQLTKKGRVAVGSKFQYEAQNSIQIKVGDAAALRININGKTYNWGKSGQTVTKSIRKVKDPIEQTKFKILIKDL